MNIQVNWRTCKQSHVFHTVHAHKYTSTHVQSPFIWNSRLPSSLQCIVGTGQTNHCVTSVLHCISLHSRDGSEYGFILFRGSGKRQLSSKCNASCIVVCVLVCVCVCVSVHWFGASMYTPVYSMCVWEGKCEPLIWPDRVMSCWDKMSLIY